MPPRSGDDIAADAAAPEPALLWRTLPLLVALAAAALALWMYRPPAPVPVTAAPAVFSAERALAHVARIAAEPRPVASAHHAWTKHYIMEVLTGLGLEPRDTPRIALMGGDHRVRGARVQNIVARIPGDEEGPAVLIAAHYDSVPTSPGASDNGAAVGALLETARALVTGPRLRRDVLLLFSDAEELGMLGAHAFAAQDPLWREVGAVLNFDARGMSGPSMMYQTTPGNAWIVRRFAEVAPSPVSTSLAGVVYRYLPNGTDFTELQRPGVHGLNFAFIDDFEGYHNRLDAVDRLDRGTLQHHGDHMLSMARTLASGALSHDVLSETQGDVVYFSLLRAFMVVYPVTWELPVALAALAAVILLLVRRRHVRPHQALLGAVLFSVIVCAAAVLGHGLWWMLVRWDFVMNEVPPYHLFFHVLYLASYVVLAVSMMLGGIGLARVWPRGVGTRGLAAGALLVWAGLAVTTAVMLPGTSYVLGWPALAAVLGLWAFTGPGRSPHGKSSARSVYTPAVLVGIATVPAMLLWMPVLYGVFVALTLSRADVMLSLTVLFLGLLVPHLAWVAGARAVRCSLGAALLGLLLLAVSWLAGHHGAAYPRMDMLAYALDADRGEARWVSFGDTPSAWSRGFVDVDDARRPAAAWIPGGRSRAYLGVAPAHPLPGPAARIEQESETAGGRRLVVRVRPGRAAARLWLEVEGEGTLFAVEHRPMPGNGARRLDFWAPPAEGLVITLEARGPVRLRVTESHYGLSLPAGRERQGATMASPYWGVGLTDTTFITRRIAL